MQKKSDNILIYVLSVVLVLAAIGITAIINNVNKGNSATDVRARAGTANALKLTGFVSSVDTINNTVVLDNVNFLANPTQNGLGSWTVGIPANFKISSVVAGSQIIISVDSTTFKVSSHTVNALEISLPAK